jgi:hypothetical protein
MQSRYLIRDIITFVYFFKLALTHNPSLLKEISAKGRGLKSLPFREGI